MSKQDKAQVAEQNATSKFANADNVCVIDVKRALKHDRYDAIVHLIGHENCNNSYVYAYDDEHNLVLVQDSNCARNISLHAIIDGIVEHYPQYALINALDNAKLIGLIPYCQITLAQYIIRAQEEHVNPISGEATIFDISTIKSYVKDVKLKAGFEFALKLLF